MRAQLGLLGALLSVGCTAAAPGASDGGSVGGDGGAGAPVTVTSGAMRYRGARLDADGSARFLGIRYAAAPTRFAPSVAAPAAPGELDATSFGAACPGTDASRAKDEACLLLHVWTPSVAADARRPVLVFLADDGEDLAAHVYDGLKFARVGGVLVTVQSRRGALGFLSHAALGEGSSDAGLGDVLLALGWVRDHIAAFGGDPQHVLLFGHGEGARLACAVRASPASAGLLTAVGLQSGTCIAAGALPAVAEARSRADALVATLGCTGEVGTCLRTAPLASLTGDFAPAVGTPLLPRAPTEALADASAAQVPYLLGATRTEPDAARCAMLATAALVRGAGAPVYAYEFDYAAAEGSGFGAELPYVFGNAPLTREFTDPEVAFVYDVMSAWVSFARMGDPTGAGAQWAPWTASSGARARLAPGLGMAGAPPTCL